GEQGAPDRHRVGGAGRRSPVSSEPARGPQRVRAPARVAWGPDVRSSAVLRTIVSGGQAGVDRAALAFAREAGLRVEGFCPAAFWAEDGSVPEPLREGLRPTPERDPAVRTR